MERRRRIAAYGLCADRAGAVLLVRLSGTAAEPGRWLLPGGGVHQGEHPARAVVREIAEETGLRVRVTRLHSVVADVVTLPDRAIHNDRVVYDVEVRGGELRDETRAVGGRGGPEPAAEQPGSRSRLSGTTDRARWVPRDQVGRLPLVPFTAEALGAPEAAALAPEPVGTLAELGHEADQPGPAEPGVPRGQRFAAYALATDPADRVLLTRIAAGYPGSGRWHLPGGGTEFGEQPVAALLRELAEEADQVGVVTDLLGVSHRHNPRALGPEGYPIDWHTVRALYRVLVEAPTTPRVTESAGGSTDAAGWFDRAEAVRLPLTEIARRALVGPGRRAGRTARKS